jgi:hypothetical protein
VGLGLLAILATTRFPKGLWGYVSARFDLHLFPVHCRLSRGDDPRSAKARA